ncbi:MAG: SUMF1/EgtB/PvdO family nonheme iron enzyme [Desulfovibrionaceae bacterium]|nr:SUMF1/EgtB/PvdO family nonheme iron enzyme [Desulfovibrionaceae bacterium]
MRKATVGAVSVLALAGMLVLYSAAQGAKARKVALVIGNSDYATSPLKNPVNDAADMAKKLKQLGFDVVSKLNADKRTMVQAVDEFGGRLKGADVGLFYFAGHGMQIKGRNYLIPVKVHIASEADVEFEGLDAGRVLSRMESAGNRLSIVVLDACRDNPFARSFRSAEQGLAQMDAPTGSLIAYATAPGSVAADGSGRNGLYTQHLLRNMDVPGMGVERMFKNVRIGVLNDTGGKQTPWESSSLTGDFYFAGQPKAIEAQPLDKSGTLKMAAEDSEKRGNSAPEQTLALAPAPPLPPVAQLKVKTGETWNDPATGMSFAFVPGGCFEMGCGPWTGECGQDEAPVHEVCVRDFWIGRYEVTQGQWKKVMGVDPPRPGDSDAHPAAGVSFDDAQEFIDTLAGLGSGRFRYRLPTEAEWEYACRSGGKPEAFSGATSPSRSAWYAGNSGFKTHPVGTLKPNGLGIYDMSGNVWEWVQDVYDAGAYAAHAKDNPLFEKYGSHRVLRGGSYNFAAGNARCSGRYRGGTGFRGEDFGLRLVREP